MLSFFPNIPPAVPVVRQIADSRVDLTEEPILEVSKLLDVYPNDWHFLALQSLIQRYKISSITIKAQPLKRYEFAIYLRFLTKALDTAQMTHEDLRVFERLTSDFHKELFFFQQRWDSLSPPMSNLENKQFSPTFILSGEAIVGISDDLGEQTQDNLSLQQRTRINLEASFTGKDELQISLVQGNIKRFSYVGNVTHEGRLGFDTNTNNQLELNNLSYRFSLSEKATLFLAPKGDGLNAINSLFESRANGSISRFGRKNPIYHLADSGGINLTYKFSDSVRFLVGYYAGELNDARSGNGLFEGDYSIVTRFKFEPSEDISFGFLYIHSYNDSDLRTGTGSRRSQIDLNRSVVGNSYSLETSFELSPKFTIGGWVGLTQATVISLGNAQIWNYALTFAFADLGKEGNLLGFVVGMEPKLTGTTGFKINDDTKDADTSLHIEGFYRYRISDNLSITPGFIWITAPDHNNDNGNIVVVTTRISIRF